MDNSNSHKNSILETIENKGIKMRPKWYYTLHATLAFFGACILFLTLLFLISFIFFASRQTGSTFAPQFGFPGLYIFLTSLPWILVIISIIFLAILEILVQHYSFAYRRPLLYSTLFIVCIVLAGGFIINKTPLHGRLSNFANENRLPFVAPMFRRYVQQRIKNVYVGKIVEATDNRIIMLERHGEKLTIVKTSRTRVPFGEKFFIGDTITVFGNCGSSTVQAIGIRKMKE